MTKTLILIQKELSAYFKSAIAYIVLIAAIGVFNIFFYMIIDQNREATLRDVFSVMEFMLVFLVPLFTMRIFAEEKATGTMEFLVTTPTSNTAIVLGKYLGSFLFFTLILALTGAYYFIIEYFGNPDRWPVLTGFLGLWLEGGLFVSIGVMTSSWTRSQVIAAIVSYVILFLLYFSSSLLPYMPGAWGPVIKYMCALTHFANFNVGLINLADIIYYLSGIALCLAFTRLSVENRLW